MNTASTGTATTAIPPEGLIVDIALLPGDSDFNQQDRETLRNLAATSGAGTTGWKDCTPVTSLP